MASETTQIQKYAKCTGTQKLNEALKSLATANNNVDA